MDQQTVSLRQYLTVLRRRRLVIVVTVVAVAVTAFAAALFETPTYASRTDVIIESVRQANQVSFDEGGLDAVLRTEPVVMTSRPVLERVVEDIGGSVDGLRSQIATEVVGGNTRVVRITVTDEDPARAAEVANSVAESYLEHRRSGAIDNVLAVQDDLDRRAADLRERIDELQSQIEVEAGRVSDEVTAEFADRLAAAVAADEQAAAIGEGSDQQATVLGERADEIARRTSAETAALVTEREGLLRALGQITTQSAEFHDSELVVTGGGQVLRPAEIPSSPVSPQPLRTLLFALVLGLVGGVGLAFLRDHLDDRVGTDEDVKRATGERPVLGRIPHWRRLGTDGEERLVSMVDPAAASAEAYRTMWTNLRFLLAVGDHEDGLGRVVTVGSAAPGEGKTSSAANLAVLAARSGQRVVLVDADLRRPAVASRLGLLEGVGLAEALLDPGGPADYLRDVGVHGLAVLPSGTPPPNPTELLGSPAMASLVRELRARFDLVVMDSAPVLAVADALELGRLSDVVVLVARFRRSHRRRLGAAMERLATVGVHVGGTVINDLPSRDTEYYGYLPSQSASGPPYTEVSDAPGERAAARTPGRTGEIAHPPR